MATNKSGACPVKGSISFQDLVNITGREDVAYLIFEGNRGVLPRESSSFNNDFIWGAERRLDLVKFATVKDPITGKNKTVKKYRGYTTETRKAKIQELNSLYTGNFKIHSIEGDTGTGYGIKIEGRPILKSLYETADATLSEKEKEEVLNDIRQEVENEYALEQQRINNEIILPISTYEQRVYKEDAYNASKGDYFINSSGNYILYSDGTEITRFKADLSDLSVNVGSKVTPSNKSKIKAIFGNLGYTSISFDGVKYESILPEPKVSKDVIEYQKEVLLKSLHQVKNIVEDSTITVAGLLEAGGKTIRYNPILMTTDTLGHEFGHLLIDMLGGLSNPMINRGVEQLKDTELAKKVTEQYNDLTETKEGLDKLKKEILAQAIGEEVDKLFKSEEGKSRFRIWLDRFFRALKDKLGLERNEAKRLANMLVSNTPVAADKLKGTVSDYIQEQRSRIEQETSTPAQIAEAIKSISDEITFEVEGHTYTLKGTQLMPVSTLMKENGYGIQGEVDDAVLERASKIGTLIHSNADAISKGVKTIISDDSGYSISPVAYASLNSIVAGLISPGDTVMTEVVVADDKAQVAGTIDMVIITKEGEVKLYDFKTKAKYNKKGEYKGFKYYNSTKYGASNRNTNRLQLSLYADILKRTLGLNVSPTLTVIPLVVDTKGTRIQTIELEKEYSDTDTNLMTFDKSMLSSKLLRERTNKLKRKVEEDIPTVTELGETEFKKGNSLTNPLDKYAKVYDDALGKLYARYQEAIATGKAVEADKVKQIIDRIQSYESNKGLLAFIKSANTTVDSMYSIYLSEKNKIAKGEQSDVLTAKTLVKWYKTLSSYDTVLDDILSLYMQDMFSGDGASVTERVKDVLKDTISKKNLLRDLYKTIGKDTLRDSLYMYNGRVAKEIEEQKQREWLSMSKAEQARTGLDMKSYARKYVEDNAKEIDDQARLMFDKELERASEDIGLMARWLDGIVDSNDMVVSALIKKFVILDGTVRSENIKAENEMLDVLEPLEKYASYNTTKNISTMYNFMLEKDDKGVYTGHILTKYKSTLQQEEDAMLREASKKPESKRREFKKEWYDKNMPLNKEAFDAALNDYVTFMYDSSIISDYEFLVYKRNRLLAYDEKLFYDIEDAFNSEAADMYLTWVVENARKYRTPAVKYVNPEYTKLEAVLKNPNDPRTKMYNHILKVIEETDSKLPYNKRLHTKLPFDYKSELERIQSGQSVKSVAKETFSTGLIRRGDELDRGVAIGEGEKAVNFVPIRYTRPNEWSIEDQSFDLGTLYLNWQKMANDYESKYNLLPEIELTKLIIDNREYIHTDSKGNPITKVYENYKARYLTKHGSKSLLAEQLDDWLKANIYGQKKADQGTFDILGVKIDKAKAGDLLNKYTAMNLLGLNVMSGIANINLGELNQIIESSTGQYLTTKELHNATTLYTRNLFGMVNDMGTRRPKNVISALNHKWNILNYYGKDSVKDNLWLSKAIGKGGLFITSHMGEHFMQTRIMLAMLGKVDAKDSSGKSLGSMLSMYKTVNGKLELDPSVDLEKSKWTEVDQVLFGEKVKRLLSSLHGEYTEVGKNAAQRYVLGRMGFLFRRFIVPGTKRRWQGKKYNVFLDDFTEGTYITTGKFIRDIHKDLFALRFALVSEEWNKLLPREKANVKRALTEVSMMIATSILATVLMGLAGESGDDDEKFWLNHLAYQSYRLNSELSFYLNPAAAWEIIRTPAASMSVFESALNLIGDLLPWNITEKYEKGNWAGQYKWEKSLTRLIPAYKQLYRVRDIDDLTKIMGK